MPATRLGSREGAPCRRCTNPAMVCSSRTGFMPLSHAVESKVRITSPGWRLARLVEYRYLKVGGRGGRDDPGLFERRWAGPPGAQLCRGQPVGTASLPAAAQLRRNGGLSAPSAAAQASFFSRSGRAWPQGRGGISAVTPKASRHQPQRGRPLQAARSSARQAASGATSAAGVPASARASERAAHLKPSTCRAVSWPWAAAPAARSRNGRVCRSAAIPPVRGCRRNAARALAAAQAPATRSRAACGLTRQYRTAPTCDHGR
jgi:hypothetical protein